jgi:putative intracellular protease/amidase
VDETMSAARIREDAMAKRVLFIASNYGLWAEELQAPWDAVKQEGHTATLATYKGVTPLPLEVSLDADFIDPLQHYNVNPKEVVQRVNEILDTGEWSQPRRIVDVRPEEFDALVMVGGPGAPLDITGNMAVHALVLNAYRQGKVVAAICYAVAALAFTRDPEDGNRSVIHRKRVTAHPHAWDFDYDISYPLVRRTADNPGTDVTTPGFVFPLQHMVEDAVADASLVISDATANRDKPCMVWDKPFLTALSVESSIAFGNKLVELLAVET